ncbi:pilus assembly protein [Marinimicrobium koreense]|jgi:type IV pilus assembly protein PilY1|uniref:pilus assembly protein n=1 Tax=Marinimicrobium koreense TaxID=306545 RepID=UPI003F6F0208
MKQRMMSSVLYRGAWALGFSFLSVATTHTALAAEPAQSPLFMTQPVRPVAMLNMSNDHQLFFKLYDDYSDIDGDGEPDTTYKHDYDYYGYFDSGLCYEYTNSRFEPVNNVNADRYCNDGSTGEWSGNFLNWATMTRMDAVRKILYGGKRSTDSATQTVLERAFLPNDAHSFAKYYNGRDISSLTPLNPTITGNATDDDSGITICNTTDPSDRDVLSQNVDSAPLMRVAEGNYSLWASNERWQCRWGQGTNDNDSTVSGIYAHSSSPTKDGEDDSALNADYNVRVEVCDENFVSSDNASGCVAYGESLKPTGLLQEFGEDESIYFGLMTGTYSANKSGGALRKNVGSMANEINANGTFVTPADPDSFDGIVNTLDRLRIYGYRFDNGTYFGQTGSDSCSWELASFTDGNCSNWGNPQSELYLESLRYLAGQSANDTFDVSDSGRIDGLNKASWVAPVNGDNYCAPVNVIQFNASTSSYDGDQLTGFSDLGAGESTLDSFTNAVGAAENIHGNQYFVGEVGGEGAGDNNQLCTAKTVSGLASVQGTCPDAPRLQGSYQIAGLAYYARSEGLQINGVSNDRRSQVKTYGVALAPSVPQVSVPVPGGERTVSIQPACRNTTTDPDANCAIVDFKVVDQVNTDAVSTGKLYVNWEDSEQGGDYDQDMWGIIEYSVTSTSVTVTTDVVADSTPNVMGFGYVIGGTTNDGFHVHSGINGFKSTSGVSTISACDADSGCDEPDAKSSSTFVVGTSSAQPLEQPLYFAAKWGGYADEDEADIAASANDNYFFATDPRELQRALRKTFGEIAAGIGAASSVATNSTRLTEGSFVYQALFNSENWSGEIRSFEIGANGAISSTVYASTNSGMPSTSAGRTVYTYNDGGTGNAMVDFTWENLSDTQRNHLIAGDTETLGQDRLNWVKGDRSKEGTGGLREREKLLGDIVNSSPVYLGGRDFGYGLLPAELGGDTYAAHVEDKRSETPTLFVGANDGMLHAFYAEGNSALQERFAYVPNGVYSKLATIASPNYGREDVAHEYTVDGPLAVGDAYVGGEWKSVLVGTFGAGGKGIFALDVTDPDFPELMFELAPSDLSALGNMGYILSQPQIARMANGRWAVVFGNGYDAGTSQLFIVDLENPTTQSRVIDTEAGTGLSGVALLGNAYGEINTAYAGDLQGNLWRFDLSDTRPDRWDVGLSGNPLFVAKDDDGDRQPITSAPTLGFNSLKRHTVTDSKGVIMVYFGTGKYFENSDNLATADTPQNSFYAIADLGSELDYTSNTAQDGRTSILHEKAIIQGTENRTIDGQGRNEPDWTDASVNGWFIDFDTALGERVVSKPLLLFDRLIFPTLIPSGVACEFGGRSWLMELVAIGDRYYGENLLDGIEEYDSLILGDPTFGVVGQGAGKLILNPSDGGVNGQDGEIGRLLEEDVDIPTDALGRQSWRQIR